MSQAWNAPAHTCSSASPPVAPHRPGVVDRLVPEDLRRADVDVGRRQPATGRRPWRGGVGGDVGPAPRVAEQRRPAGLVAHPVPHADAVELARRRRRAAVVEHRVVEHLPGQPRPPRSRAASASPAARPPPALAPQTRSRSERMPSSAACERSTPARRRRPRAGRGRGTPGPAGTRRPRAPRPAGRPSPAAGRPR